MSEINTYSVTIKVEEEILPFQWAVAVFVCLQLRAFVALMENAAAALADKVLDNDELTTVGTMISIEHTSPTPLGAEVTATAVLKSVDGRMFNFEVFAEDKKGEIARGTHTRVSVKSEKISDEGGQQV